MEENKSKVLIIEDDADIREALKRMLSTNYTVAAAKNGPEGLSLAESLNPDLIILDILLPGMEGDAVCETLRADPKTRKTPIVGITASSDEDRRAKLFFAGADDVVSKPIRIKEFMARIQTRLKKHKDFYGGDEIIRCGNITLDLGRLEAKVDEKNVNLTVLEFKVLKYFVANQGRVLTRDMILESMWQKDVTARVIDNHIVSLRKKIKDAEFNIVSIYGAGYSLKKKEA